MRQETVLDSILPFLTFTDHIFVASHNIYQNSGSIPCNPMVVQIHEPHPEGKKKDLN